MLWVVLSWVLIFMVGIAAVIIVGLVLLAQGNVYSTEREFNEALVAPAGLGMLAGAIVSVLLANRPTTWRFSLRTLLIATTLIAVGLGLLVWAAR